MNGHNFQVRSDRLITDLKVAHVTMQVNGSTVRILFSSSPAYGHLLPMLPLLRSASRAGHDVAILTSADLADVLSPVRLLASGPSFAELLVENARRNPAGMGARDGSKVGPAQAAEFFAGARVDVTFPEALTASSSFAPDLIMAETADYVGPLVADALGVPWARHGFGVELPGPFTGAMDALATAGYKRNAVARTPRRAYLDPCADFLQRVGGRRQQTESRSDPNFSPRQTRPGGRPNLRVRHPKESFW